MTGSQQRPAGTLASVDRCAARDVLDRVGDKWSVYVLALLGDGTRRFMDLRRSIEGISQRMLTVTLRNLERDGLIRRTVYPVVPPRVDYALTPLGRTLRDVIDALVTWAEKHTGDIRRARAAYDRRAAGAAESRRVSAGAASPARREVAARA
jgi:DNA-binding HxlR family transcriptional regulator